MAKRTRAEAAALFDPPKQRVRIGRVERGAADAITAARKAGQLDETDALLTAAMRATARAVDVAERTEQPYAIPQLVRELRELAAAMRWTKTGDATDDALAAFLAGLSDSDPTRAH